MIPLCVSALVALALASPLACRGQSGGRQRGRPIEFSEPRGENVTTNLQELTSRKDGLKQLEEDLYAPLQSFTPRSSLEGVVAPPPRPVQPSAIQSKRIKELLEKRRNWVFMKPEDLISGPTVEQILKKPDYGPDGQEKKELPPLEAYYQRLVPKPLKVKPKGDEEDAVFGAPAKPGGANDSARNQPELPQSVAESAKNLQTLLAGSPLSDSDSSSSTSDPFRLGLKPPTLEQQQDHKKLMDQYRALLEPRHPAPVVPSVGGGSPEADKSAAIANPLQAAPPTQTSRRPWDAQMNVLYPQLGPAPLPDVSAESLRQSRAVPTATQTRRVMPAVPDFTAPRRKF